MKRIFILTVIAMLATVSQAQIGIGTKNPNKAAKLHVSSESQGVLIPSISSFAQITSDINNLSPADKADAVGMMVFYNVDSLFYTWDGADWQCLNPTKSDRLTGRIEPTEPFTEFGGPGTVPLGGIIMWSGDTNTIPEGWDLCNGDNGTPDLSGRFIVGVGYNEDERDPRDTDATTLNVGDRGGIAKYTFNSNEVPLRNHTHRVSGSTVNGGSHLHYAHNTLTMEETKGDNRRFARLESSQGSENHRLNKLDGSHTHTVNIESQNPSQSLSQNAHDNRPPYYVMAFIMRVE